MYIPEGQCLLYRRDAYSNESATRVVGLSDDASHTLDGSTMDGDDGFEMESKFFAFPATELLVEGATNPLNEDIDKPTDSGAGCKYAGWS